MRFGICTAPENATLIKRVGFDYIELGVAGILRPFESDSAVMPALQIALDRADLAAEAFNGMLPPDLKLVGPIDSIDYAVRKTYLTNAFSRAHRLGGKVVVFGSGAARMVPEGFSRSTAEALIADFLDTAGEIAGNYDIDIAIEPLNKGECNILNSVAEGVAMAARVGHPRVKVLSDLYHVAEDRQPYDETADAGSELAHVHIARPGNRLAPRCGDERMLAAYFAAVREAHYDSRISIEAGWVYRIGEEAEEALDVMKAAWTMSDAKREQLSHSR